MIYFDSAYIAKFYLAEPESERVRMAAEIEGSVACSMLGRVEICAVFHRKLREKAFDAKAFRAIMAQFDADLEASLWTWLPLSEGVIDVVAKRFQRLPATTFLRSADALHLATAAENGFHEIFSNDRHLLAAASHFGLRARSL
jgi:predicted nucleic acid-binding protein